MKQKSNFYIGGSILIIILLTSCVSRKKFNELERTKMASDQEIMILQSQKKALENKLSQTEEEFNAIRYKMTASNAAKDKRIQIMTAKLRQLEGRRSELTDELSLVSDKIKSDEKLTRAQIEKLQNELLKISQERDSLKRDMAELKTNLNWENQKLERELQLIKEKRDVSENQISTLKEEINRLNDRLRTLDAQKSKDKAEIEKLTNQVNLLKKHLK